MTKETTDSERRGVGASRDMARLAATWFSSCMGRRGRTMGVAGACWMPGAALECMGEGVGGMWGWCVGVSWVGGSARGSRG